MGYKAVNKRRYVSDDGPNQGRRLVEKGTPGVKASMPILYEIQPFILLTFLIRILIPGWVFKKIHELIGQEWVRTCISVLGIL